MGVAATCCSRRHIIKVVDPLDRERNVAIAFDEGEVSSVIHDLGEINDTDRLGRCYQATRRLGHARRATQHKVASLQRLSGFHHRTSLRRYDLTDFP